MTTITKEQAQKLLMPPTRLLLHWMEQMRMFIQTTAVRCATCGTT